MNRRAAPCTIPIFRDLYKQSFNKSERQEARRKNLLEQQKLKRLEEQDGHRQFEEAYYSEGVNTWTKKNKNTDLENIDLQFSEWFKEKPESLDDWLLVPCPKGQRCLVVAEKGKTKMFSKNKRFRMAFSSSLPGGGLFGSDNDCCILDCIYCPENDTFYVLDALHFCISLIDCETEFRFFWLKSKFSEINELEQKFENWKSFQLLNNYDATNEASLVRALQTYPLWENNQPKLDGFLFYHKTSHYTFGTTPLVCWLFPFMIPDVLQIIVSNIYVPPVNYCRNNPWQYMEEFDKEMAQKRNIKMNKKETTLHIEAMEDLDSLEEHQDNLKSLLAAERILELKENF